MALYFPNASVISYSRDSKFLGENFHYANTKNLSIQGFILDGSGNSSGVKEVFQKMSGIIYSGAESGTSITDSYHQIFLNNQDIGSGIVNNISFGQADNNTVRRSNYTAEIQIFDTGFQPEFENFGPDTGYYSGVSGVLTTELNDKGFSAAAFLDDLTESFSFEKSQGGGYSFTHNVSLRFLDNSEAKAVSGAKIIASGLFNREPSFGLLDNEYSGYYSKLKESGTKDFTESYDLINLSFNFSKSYELLGSECFENSGVKYNLATNHVFNVSEDGKVTIQENGSVKSLETGYGVAATNAAISGAIYEINQNSFGRVGTIYSGYKDSGNGKYLFSTNYPSYSTLSGLAATPIDKNFSVDVNSNSVNYSVTFTNDPFYDVSGSATTEYSVSESQNNILQLTENTRYRFNFATGLTTGALALIKAKYESLTGSRQSISNGLGTNYISFADPVVVNYPASNESTLTQTNLSISNGDQLSFSYTKTSEYNDALSKHTPYKKAQSINSNLKKFSIDSSDTFGQSIFSTYNVNNSTRSQILQKLNIEDVSKRSINIQAVVKRSFETGIRTGLSDYYLESGMMRDIEIAAINEALKFVPFSQVSMGMQPIEGFITDASCTFDNEYNLNYNMDVTFITLQ